VWTAKTKPLSRVTEHFFYFYPKEIPMSDLSMLINGLKVSAEKGATFERRNPLDGSVATRAPAASPADAVMAADAAAEAFKTWSQTGPTERRMLLLKAADALERRERRACGPASMCISPPA
jgi:hypothetical protein